MNSSPGGEVQVSQAKPSAGPTCCPTDLSLFIKRSKARDTNSAIALRSIRGDVGPAFNISVSIVECSKKERGSLQLTTARNACAAYFFHVGESTRAGSICVKVRCPRCQRGTPLRATALSSRSFLLCV